MFTLIKIKKSNSKFKKCFSCIIPIFNMQGKFYIYMKRWLG